MKLFCWWGHCQYPNDREAHCEDIEIVAHSRLEAIDVALVAFDRSCTLESLCRCEPDVFELDKPIAIK